MTPADFTWLQIKGVLTLLFLGKLVYHVWTGKRWGNSYIAFQSPSARYQLRRIRVLIRQDDESRKDDRADKRTGPVHVR